MKKAGLIFLAGALSGALLMQQVMTAQPAAPANNTQTTAPVVQAEPIATTTQTTPTVRQSATPLNYTNLSLLIRHRQLL